MSEGRLVVPEVPGAPMTENVTSHQGEMTISPPGMGRLRAGPSSRRYRTSLRSQRCDQDSQHHDSDATSKAARDTYVRARCPPAESPMMMIRSGGMSLSTRR